MGAYNAPDNNRTRGRAVKRGTIDAVRTSLLRTITLAVAALLAMPALAADYPAKSVRILSVALPAVASTLRRA